MLEHFDNNTLTPDYFKGQEFIKIKNSWKWNLPARNDASLEDQDFFETVLKKSSEIDLSEDEHFFAEETKNHSSNTEQPGDKSFFEKVEQKVDEFGQKVDEKLEGATQKAAEVATVSKGQKQ